MNRPQLMKLAGGLVLLAAVMTTIALLPAREEPTLYSEAFFDAGHVPLFLVFGLLVFGLARATVPGPGRRHYLVTAALVVLAGLGTEFVQKFVARDAGWTDFLRDLLGGGAALLLALAVESRRLLVRVSALLAALALIGLGLAELAHVHLDYRNRDAAFPSLAAFEAGWEPRFVHGHDAKLEVVPAPAAWSAAAGSWVGQLDTRVADYPSLSIHEPFPDWRGYDALVFEVWSESPDPVELTVRVHDRKHDDRYLDRYNGTFRIEPGANRVRVSLDDVRAAPSGRSLDLGHVAGVAIFLDHPAEPVRLWFRGLRLVGE